MRPILKIVVVLCLLIGSMDSFGQLITDSDRRLKTQKTEKKVNYRKRSKKAGESPKAGAQQFKFSGARYSPASPFKSQQRVATPRYSPAERRGLFRNRYSAPRYSSPSVFRSRAIAPRYSPGSPFTRQDLAGRPRYSPPTPFKKRSIVPAPRYSPGSPWKQRDLVRNPRYSPGNPWTRKDLVRSPRYSPGSPWGKQDLVANPRYSPGSPFENIKWNVSPWYSTNKHRFVVDKRMKKQSAIYNFESSKYKGDYKVKLSKKGLMHPSYAYRDANPISMSTKEMLRKWNVFWARLETNKVQPPAVKEKISKPKFDRKETEIWNN